MRIEYLLFAIYLVLSFWLIPKVSFIRHADLSARQTKLLLALKILSGIACAYYFGRMPPIGDYWYYNTEGKIQYELLLSNPILFFTDFRSDLHTYGTGRLLDTSNSFWGYLRFNLVYKFVAILNLITRGNFYFNSAIFSSIVFLGHIAFYRIFSEIYAGHKLKIVFACFLLPSLLLYTSCVHKDGIIFLSAAVVSFIFYNWLTRRGSINIKYASFFLLGMMVIFLFRNYVLIALVPAMITTLLCKWLPYPKRIVYISSYLFYFALFFLSGYIRSSLNLPAAVVTRKADFAALGMANTNISMNELQPTLQSFFVNLPQAINHSLFRPYLWEFSSPGVILTAIELFFYQLVIIAFVFFRRKEAVIGNSFNLFGWPFFITMMLIIGYTIPNIGAIVRYRSIFWVFLICPLLCTIDWKRLVFFKNRLPKNKVASKTSPPVLSKGEGA